MPTARATGWVAADGGVFAFGDATFRARPSGMSPSSPIVGLAPTADRRLLGGGGRRRVYAFGDAPYAAPRRSTPRRWASTPSATATGWSRATAGPSHWVGPPSGLAGRPAAQPADRGHLVDRRRLRGRRRRRRGFTFGSSASTGPSGGEQVHTRPGTAPARHRWPRVVDYGLSAYQIAAWDRVNLCEEGGDWHVEGSVFAGGLGMSRANWAGSTPSGSPATPPAATPLPADPGGRGLRRPLLRQPRRRAGPERLLRRLLSPSPPARAGTGPGDGSRPLGPVAWLRAGGRLGAAGGRWPGPGRGRAR